MTSRSSHPASIFVGPPGTSLLHEAYTCMRADDSRTLDCTYIDLGTPLEARGMRSSLSCHHTSISQSYLVEPWNYPDATPSNQSCDLNSIANSGPNFVETGVAHWLSRFCRRLTTYFFLGQPGQRDNTSTVRVLPTVRGRLSAGRHQRQSLFEFPFRRDSAPPQPRRD